MPQQTGPKRSKEQRERDLAEMAQMLRRGVTQVSFARRFGVGQPQIHRDLAELDRRWKQTQLSGVDAQRRKQLEELAEVRSEAWRAWEASQQERVETTTERVGPPSSEGTAVRQVARIVKKPPEWAVSALNTVLAALSQEADLLGTKAPTKGELTGKNGEDLVFRVVYGGSTERRALAVQESHAELVDVTVKELGPPATAAD